MEIQTMGANICTGRRRESKRVAPQPPGLGELVKCAQRKRQQISHGAYLDVF